MALDATQLLKRLDPAVRPGYAGVAPSRPLVPLEHQSFEQLLGLASRGSMTSGRQVECGCDLHPPLDAAQLERLTDAADKAEAGGSRTALMLMDGRALIVDVASRSITGEIHSASSASMFKVDSAVRVSSALDGANALVPFPSAGVMPKSLATH